MTPEVPSKGKWEDKSILLRMMLLVSLFALFLIICGIGYLAVLHNSQENSSKESVTSIVATSTNTGMIFLAVENKEQNPPPANNQNLMREYYLVSIDPITNEQKRVGFIQNNFYNETFYYSHGKVFFGNPYGELSTYDLNTQSEVVLKIPGIVPSLVKFPNEDTIESSFIRDDKIFYLKGICAEGSYCAIGVYDMSTGLNEIIVDDLEKKVSTRKSMVEFSNVNISSEKNTVTFVVRGGDGGLGFATLYEIDLATKELSEVMSAADSVVCRLNEQDCTEEDRISDINMEKIFEEPELYCGGTKIEYNGYDKNIILSLNAKDTIVPDARYVGCEQR